MCNRRCQFDVAHPLTAHLGKCNLNATFLTDYAPVFQALVLPAQTFIVFVWTKNLGTEQPVTLGLERTVVNGFGLLDLTI